MKTFLDLTKEEYYNKEVWFNINANTIQIWKKQYCKSKINLSIYRLIYNLKKLGEVLEKFGIKKITNK